MTGYVVTIHPDGRVTAEAHDAEASLKQTQGAVGGYIEVVPYMTSVAFGHLVAALNIPDLTADPQPCVALCNEDGKGDGLPVNAVATQLWAETLVRDEHVKPGRNGMIPMSDVLVGPVAFVVGAEALASEAWK